VSDDRFDFGLIRRFLGYLSSYRRDVVIGVTAVPVSIVCSVLFPWLIMHVIDTQIISETSRSLLGWCALLLMVLAVNYAADGIFGYYLQKSALCALRDMRADMFARVLRFPRSYFDKTPIGVTLTRLSSDLEAVNESFAQGLLSMVRDVLTTLALLIFLAFISWKLTLMLLLIGPPTYYVTEFLRARLRESYASGRVVLSQGTGYLQECLNGIKTVQLYNAEAEVCRNYAEYTDGFYHAQSRSNFFDSTLFSIIEGVTTIAMALIIWYGASEILDANISYGVLIGFTQTLDRIFVPLRDFTSQIASIQRALAAFGHIEEIYQQPLQDEKQLAPGTAAQIGKCELFESLVFENVRFRYTPTGAWVLKGLDFEMRRGQKIALVGSTGSGKSTILRLLTKTYDNYEGSIRLNGHELRTLTAAEVAHFFSLMQQEVFLFNETIDFNIGLGREGIDRQAVEAAARYVYANEFIERLPQRYDFVLTSNGANLSSGQGQLLAFARAIASGSDVVLLDEATSSVDSVTEQLIQQAIDHVFKEKTVIAIAHRLSTIRHSDQILVLDNGRIVERGNHEALLQQSGIYAGLLNELAAAEA